MSTLLSRTAFDALHVDEGEDSDVEDLSSEAQDSPILALSPLPQVKPTKSALKKAAKAARLEKKIQKSSATGATTSRISRSSPVTDELEPSSSLSTLVVPMQTEIEDAQSPLVVNGDSFVHIKTAEMAPESKLPTVTDPAPTPPKQLSQQQRQFLIKPSADLKKEEPLPVPPAAKPVDLEQKLKRQNVLTRTLWTFIMIGGFLTLLLLGHAYMIILIMLCQTLAYREVTALFSIKYIEGEDTSVEKDPWSKTLNWYFFAVANYYLYGESIIYYFKHVVFADAQLMPFATNHRIISFTLYTIGFVGFVLSLKKGHFRRQFGLFGWVHMSLLLVVVSSHFIVYNILEGLIWLWVPASLVICNDVFAYIWGMTVGRTPLIKLSPKKTVEGFVGAFFSTILFGIFWGSLFMRWDYMICPVRDLGVNVWISHGCDPNHVFIWKEWEIWAPMRAFASSLFGLSLTTIPYTLYHFHIFVMAIFASVVAPFGGFFASGFKRAFNIKDFGQSIPGHGGMTDRMDCQFLMGVFTYVYYSSIIRENRVTVGSVLQTVVSGLTIDEQLELIADLRRYLAGQGITV